MSTANISVANAVQIFGPWPQAAATEIPNTHATAVITKNPGRVICTSVRQGSWAEMVSVDTDVN
jgi:hypothetical protein